MRNRKHKKNQIRLINLKNVATTLGISNEITLRLVAEIGCEIVLDNWGAQNSGQILGSGLHLGVYKHSFESRWNIFDIQRDQFLVSCFLLNPMRYGPCSMLFIDQFPDFRHFPAILPRLGSSGR